MTFYSRNQRIPSTVIRHTPGNLERANTGVEDGVEDNQDQRDPVGDGLGISRNEDGNVLQEDSGLKKDENEVVEN
jgi:hypothetical protein